MRSFAVHLHPLLLLDSPCLFIRREGGRPAIQEGKDFIAPHTDYLRGHQIECHPVGLKKNK